MSRLSRETEALLDRGRRGSTMTQAHRTRLKREVLAKAAGASILLTASSAAGWTSVTAKVVGVVAIVVAAGTGVAVAKHSGATAHETALRRAVAADAPAAARSSNAAPLFSAPPPLPPIPPIVVTAPSAPPAIAVAPPPAPGGVAAPAARGAIAVAPSSPARAPAAASLTSTLEREATLLRDADRALKNGDASRALALLDEHAATFPQSPLEPERAAEHVFALCSAGRMVEARDEASAFLRSHPSGPLAARVGSSCGARDPHTP